MKPASLFLVLLVGLAVFAPGAIADGDSDAASAGPEYCVVLAPGYLPPADVDPENCEVPDVTGTGA